MSSPFQRPPRPAELQSQSSQAAHEADAPVEPEAPPTWPHEPQWIENSEPLAPIDLARLERAIADEHWRIRRQRAPNLPPPPPPQRRTGVRWAVGTFVVLLASSAAIALYLADGRPPPDGAATDSGWKLANLGALLASAPEPSAEPKDAAPADPPKLQDRALPRLVVSGASAEDGDEILLGIAAEGPSQGAMAVITGLAQGTTLSAGRPWGSTGWIVPADQLGTTYLRPPAGFAGTMEYSVALQLADNSIVDRQSMRLEWATAPARLPADAGTPANMRSLDPQEIDLLLKRGEEFMQAGDIAGARLVLQRAAEARDARAALALAATYDPIVLRRLGVYGSAPDITKARDWYQKAQQYGSREAPQRLELLASQYR